jgi:hypothetical protein
MDLRQINDIDYNPIKGDNVALNGRYGILLENFLIGDPFLKIQWIDTFQIELWSGGWQSFLNSGGCVLVI